MNINITSKEGIVLKVAGKYIDEDITLIPDESLFATGYTVTLSAIAPTDTSSYAEYNYTTDNGLTGTITSDDTESTVLTGVSSISITNILCAMPRFLINDEITEYQFDDFSLNITEDTTIELESMGS